MQHHSDFYTQNDEIDLFELSEKLLKEKLLILGIMFLVGVVAVLAAYLLPKSFSSEAVVNQASPAQIAQLNVVTPLITQPGGFEKVISSNRVYDEYRTKLTSSETMLFAFQQSMLAQQALGNSAEDPEQAFISAFGKFRKNLNVYFDTNKQNATRRITIRYESESPEESARIINEVLLPYIRSQVIAELEDDRRTLIEQEKRLIRVAIENRETIFQETNQLQIAELQEALIQARAANIQNLKAEINPISIEDARYLLGSELITAQMDVLKDRASRYRYFSNPQPGDESKPYIRGIVEKVESLNQLQRVSTDYSSLQPVIVEQSAMVPAFADKPRKKMIVALGLVAGGMLGVFIALIRISIRSRKEKLAHDPQQSLLPQ